MSISRSAKSNRKWHAWSGDTDRLRRIVDVVETWAATACAQAVDALGPAPPPLDELGDPPEDPIERLQYNDERRKLAYRHEDRDRSQKRIVERFVVTCTAHEADLEQKHTGSFAALSDARLDWPSIRAFHMNFRDIEQDIRIELRMNRSDGIQLEVIGGDAAWVRGMSESLQVEIAKGVPRWSWLRGPFGALVAFLISAGAIAIALVPYVNQFYEQGKFDGVEIISYCIFYGWMPAALIFLLARYLFAAFEVYEPGGAPKSTRYLALVGAAAFQVALAVAIAVAFS